MSKKKIINMFEPNSYKGLKPKFNENNTEYYVTLLCHHLGIKSITQEQKNSLTIAFNELKNNDEKLKVISYCITVSRLYQGINHLDVILFKLNDIPVNMNTKRDSYEFYLVATLFKYFYVNYLENNKSFKNILRFNNDCFIFLQRVMSHFTGYVFDKEIKAKFEYAFFITIKNLTMAEVVNLTLVFITYIKFFFKENKQIIDLDSVLNFIDEKIQNKNKLETNLLKQFIVNYNNLDFGKAEE